MNKRISDSVVAGTACAAAVLAFGQGMLMDMAVNKVIESAQRHSMGHEREEQ